MKKIDLVNLIQDAIPEGTCINLVGDAFIFILVYFAKFHDVKKKDLESDVDECLQYYWKLIDDKKKEELE